MTFAQREIKIQSIKRKLIDFGVSASMIDVFGKEVAVTYDALEAADTPELASFIKSQRVSHTDKSLFILAD